ncbi:hypothetical protein S83_013599 [Arachis hypogaea]
MTLIQDEQSRSGCTRIEKARHWRWISWDVILTYCLRMQNLFDCFKHALPFYHLLPIFSHQLAGYAWFLNTPEQSLSFILTDQGFDVWVENVHETRWSHGHRSYSVKNKKFLNWSWQELALYDMAEMINYIYSVTNSKLFIVGYSQYAFYSFLLFPGNNYIFCCFHLDDYWFYSDGSYHGYSSTELQKGTNLLVSCGDMLSSITEFSSAAADSIHSDEDQFDVIPPETGSVSSLGKKSIREEPSKRKNPGAVKISPWTLARLNAEEVSKAAAELFCPMSYLCYFIYAHKKNYFVRCLIILSALIYALNLFV